MATSGESFTLASNAAAGAQAGVVLLGGDYLVTWSGTTLESTTTLQVLDAAGNWCNLPVTFTTAAAAANISIPAGEVRVNLGASAAGNYVYITRIPR